MLRILILAITITVPACFVLAQNKAAPAAFQYEEIYLSIENNEFLNYKVKDTNNKYVIQWSVWNRWINTDTLFTDSTGYLEVSHYKLHLHSGINKFRIGILKPNGGLRFVRDFEVGSSVEKVTWKNDEAKDIISFDAPTFYNVYDDFGNLILTGRGDKINYSKFNPGQYQVNYDNDYFAFIKY